MIRSVLIVFLLFEDLIKGFQTAPQKDVRLMTAPIIATPFMNTQGNPLVQSPWKRHVKFCITTPEAN